MPGQHSPSMSPCRVRHSLWWTVTVCLVGWLSTPGTAAAGCGDYVLIGHGDNAAVSVSNAQLPDAHGKDSLGGNSSPSRPCSGPACRKHEAPASVPPVVPVVSAANEWLLSSGFVWEAAASVPQWRRTACPELYALTPAAPPAPPPRQACCA